MAISHTRQSAVLRFCASVDRFGFVFSNLVLLGFGFFAVAIQKFQLLLSLMYMKKFTSFRQALKKMHTKEYWFFFLHYGVILLIL